MTAPLGQTALASRGSAWVSVALVLAVSWSVSACGPKDGADCAGKDVYPSQSLPDIVDNHPSGTTFCIHDGTHRVEDHISVQSGDTFAGVYSDATRPTVTTDSAHHVFDAGTGSGATIKDLTISGAVGEDRCEPNCGRGIRGGRNLIVLRVRLTGNVNQGIGGTLSGLVVRDSVVDNNGSRTFSALDGGSSSTAGIKSVNSMSIINSHIHHTWWNGVWCDEQCGAFEVRGSRIVNNGKAGVSYEISTGPAVISGNSIQRNGWNVQAKSRRAGLLIVDSARIEVYGNVFGDNSRYGIEVADWDGRAPYVADVRIRDNTMNGDSIVGCGSAGVNC